MAAYYIYERMHPSFLWFSKQQNLLW